MGPFITIIILGFFIRVVATVIWAVSDEWPARSRAKKFYFIPFYWVKWIGDTVNSKLEEDL